MQYCCYPSCYSGPAVYRSTFLPSSQGKVKKKRKKKKIFPLVGIAFHSAFCSVFEFPPVSCSDTFNWWSMKQAATDSDSSHAPLSNLFFQWSLLTRSSTVLGLGSIVSMICFIVFSANPVRCYERCVPGQFRRRNAFLKAKRKLL